ncbi:MAG TPA: hypothetical protein PK079_14015 [Leptospiraceae bacterium]|nr:hypothetical protein [Leptospiraceae bacterium]HMY34083.1 hypothetical protein [Leptospiraceae bacterium]HMZ64600.1 hypothetical protein [Leptospiraceae bacterium]HNB98140.1 hypothetical protein [Leptospiraceae bacterium]HNC54903.1 hypothetical protein [Leptospiraceae bacterium]
MKNYKIVLIYLNRLLFLFLFVHCGSIAQYQVKPILENCLDPMLQFRVTNKYWHHKLPFSRIELYFIHIKDSEFNSILKESGKNKIEMIDFLDQEIRESQKNKGNQKSRIELVRSLIPKKGVESDSKIRLIQNNSNFEDSIISMPMDLKEGYYYWSSTSYPICSMGVDKQQILFYYKNCSIDIIFTHAGGFM